MSTNRDRTARVCRVPLTESELALLQTQATLEHTTYADLMRRALREYVERRKL